MENHLGLAYFLDHIDHVGMSVAILLLLLSIASWYLIITKSINNFIATRRAQAFLESFWEIDSLQDLKAKMKDASTDNAFAQLAKLAVNVVNNSQKRGLKKLTVTGEEGELLTRTLRNGIEQETTRVENGLTIMATAGSAAPYIGLLGTVWGIYHALIQIGLSGQGTLDKVAGPVGEALIMTAIGLLVAVPAVFAYNWLQSRNKRIAELLHAFSTDLLANINSAGSVKPTYMTATSTQAAGKAARTAPAAKPAATTTTVKK